MNKQINRYEIKQEERQNLKCLSSVLFKRQVGRIHSIISYFDFIREIEINFEI